jgi:hypothetical protein
MGWSIDKITLMMQRKMIMIMKFASYYYLEKEVNY